jgi:hypothetical protein
MRPVKLRIDGSFWDSQIYASELFLFTDYGSLRKISWRSLINSLADVHQNLQTALRVGFVDGDLFYNNKVRKILLDPAIQGPIKDQLDNLSQHILAAPLTGPVGGMEFNSPFDMSLVDTEIYYGTIIAVSDEGIFSCRTSSLAPGFSRIKAHRHHDASFLQVRASHNYTAVAAAAGHDGLFEFAFSRKGGANQSLLGQKTLSPRPCKACDWSFQSVMGWSETEAFLARFKEEKYRDRENVRLFERVIDFDEFFEQASTGVTTSAGYAWGSREKIYKFNSDGIHVVELNGDGSKVRGGRTGADKDIDAHFKGVIPATFSQDDVVATGTAPFGTVIELSDRLLVLRSDSLVDEFLGEPVHWRIFPRSEYYSNQLHIIYDDHVEIVSFVHDYFVDQSEKISGFSKGSNSSSVDFEIFM